MRGILLHSCGEDEGGAAALLLASRLYNLPCPLPPLFLLLMQGIGASLVVNDSYARTPAFAKLLADVPAPALGINGAGGTAFTSVARALAPGSTLVTYAASSGQPLRATLDLFTQRREGGGGGGGRSGRGEEAAKGLALDLMRPARPDALPPRLLLRLLRLLLLLQGPAPARLQH